MVAENVTVVDVSEVTMKVIVMEIGKQEGVRVPEAESAEDRCQDEENFGLLQFVFHFTAGWRPAWIADMLKIFLCMTLADLGFLRHFLDANCDDLEWNLVWLGKQMQQ